MNFFERICNMCLISNCREDRSRSVLVLGRFPIFPAAKQGFFRKSTLRSGSLYASLIPGTYCKFVRKPNLRALGYCFPPTCSSAGHMFSASRSRFSTDDLFRFYNDKFDEMSYNWIPLRIRVRSRNTQPHLHVLDGSSTHNLVFLFLGRNPDFVTFCRRHCPAP